MMRTDWNDDWWSVECCQHISNVTEVLSGTCRGEAPVGVVCGDARYAWIFSLQ